MGRTDTPADVQWTRSLAAVIVGLVFASGELRPVVQVPGASALPQELRALAAIPCLIINFVRGAD
jgi:hypothetical protein